MPSISITEIFLRTLKKITNEENEGAKESFKNFFIFCFLLCFSLDFDLEKLTDIFACLFNQFQGDEARIWEEFKKRTGSEVLPSDIIKAVKSLRVFGNSIYEES